MKKILKGLVAGLALLTAGSCVESSLRICSESLPGKLAEAWQSRDPAAASLVHKVLEDSLAKTYCYDLAARDNAFDLIRDLKMVDMVPLLQEVAAMDYKSEYDYHRTWDLVSIGRSLDTLSRFRDPSAVDLSRKRINSDVWLQVGAIKNLGELESWDSTEEIMQMLRNATLDGEHRGVIIAGIDFLDKSPRTSSVICPQLGAIRAALADCFNEPNVAWRCGSLVVSLSSLDSKLHCGDNGGAEKNLPFL